MSVAIRRGVGAPIGLGAAVLALVLPGCGHHAEKKATAETAVRPVSVTAAELVRKDVDRTVDVVGTLKGMDEVTVGSKRAGRVLKVLHDVGDRVPPGEPLVELDPIDAGLAYQQAETRYLSELAKLGVTRKQAEDFLAKFGIGESILMGEEVDRRIREVPAVHQAKVAVDRAGQNLGRQRLLRARDAGTAQELQNAENDAEAAQAAFDNAIITARSVLAAALASKVALDVADQARKDLIIRAPVPSYLTPGSTGGIVFAVTRKSVSEGQMLRDGDAVADLVIEDPLRLWANVPSRYSADVKVGQPVQILVDSLMDEQGQPIPKVGQVKRINPSVDPVSRTFHVEIEVPNPEGKLRPGTFAKAAIRTRHDVQAVVVPTEAVVRFAGVTKVFVVDGKAAKAVPVTTGLEGKDWVEVLGDLPTEGRVVTSGQAMLADGTPIVIREQESKKE